jgi:exodeoxyribonuclease VII large subunit
MNAITVTQLAHVLKETLESKVPRARVVGEISGFTHHSSGHMYFTLKDAATQVPVTFFRGDNQRLRFKPMNGQQVVVTGRATFFGPQGKAQLQIDTMEPVGVGAVELAKRQLMAKLRAKGYFEAERKRPLPHSPRRIGIVSSATGAVVRDMLELLGQRWPLCQAVVHHASVQGEAAPRELAQALKRLGQLHHTGQLRLDAVIIGRGGGSAEDLAAFDSEMLADAIFQSPVPVVAAIGHEIDVSIADLVADFHAETPSAAIAKLTPNRLEILGVLEVIPHRLRQALETKVLAARRRLNMIASRPAFARPLERIRQQEQRLDDFSQRLEQAAARRLKREERRLASFSERLEALSPLAVLTRGYSVTQTADGKVLRDASAVQTGHEITTRLANSSVRSVVI